MRPLFIINEDFFTSCLINLEEVKYVLLFIELSRILIWLKMNI